MGPACYHVLHLVPPAVADQMNFFFDEGLHDDDGRPTYELVPDSHAPFMFERETLASLGMPRQMAMRHRLPHFGHLFSGDSYSAGYYSYLWADTLSADAFEAFIEAEGAYDKAVAKRLRDHVFSTGNTIDPAEGYRAFRGRDAQVDALMRKRGFPPESNAARPSGD